MDDRTARGLIALNNRFYAQHAASFSATREAPWEGWSRVVLEARGAGTFDERDRWVRVLDLACGNLRFERFLASELPGVPLEFHAVDACEELSHSARQGLGRIHCCCFDVLNGLLERERPLAALPPADLSVCFGFMHHVPGEKLRRAVLDLLVGQTRPKGVIVVSFWQFMDDERLAAKARAADRRARYVLSPTGRRLPGLDANDHMLGWQGDDAALRYCHHFPEKEIDGLVTGAGLHVREICRFSADGRTGALNRYVVLQRA